MEPLSVAVALVSAGLLVAGVSVPLWLGRVKANPFYGFRTPRLVSDERAWGPVNRVAGRDLVLGGLATAAVGVAVGAGVVQPSSEAGFVLAAAGPLLVAVGHAFYFASSFVYELDHGGAVEAAPQVEPTASPTATGATARPRRERERE